MKTTNNLGLRKIELTDSPPDITVQDANWDLIDKHLNTAVRFSKATGTGNAITLSEVTLEDGFQKTFIVTTNNGGTATTINTKPLYKPGGTTPPTLTAGKAVTVWYDATGGCFFIKASAEGNAVAGDVLAGKIISNDNDIGIPGTMPNNGSVGTKNLTTEGAEYTIPAGYHNGLGKVKAVITGLIASVIKAGTTVGGILGTFTSDANAVAGDVLSGKSGYVNGAKVSGNIINRSVENNHQPATAETVSNVNGYGAYLMPPKGYYDGTWVRSLQPDLLSENIVTGKNIFGLAGTAVGKKAPTVIQKNSEASARPFQSQMGTGISQPYVIIPKSSLVDTPKTIMVDNAPNGICPGLIYSYTAFYQDGLAADTGGRSIRSLRFAGYNNKEPGDSAAIYFFTNYQLEDASNYYIPTFIINQPSRCIIYY